MNIQQLLNRLPWEKVELLVFLRARKSWRGLPFAHKWVWAAPEAPPEWFVSEKKRGRCLVVSPAQGRALVAWTWAREIEPGVFYACHQNGDWNGGPSGYAHLPVCRWPEVVLRAQSRGAVWDPQQPFEALAARLGDLRARAVGGRRYEHRARMHRELWAILYAGGRPAVRLHQLCKEAIHQPVQFRGWRQGGGHFFVEFGEWEIPLGWRYFQITRGTLCSPIQGTPWRTEVLWAEGYEESDRSYHAPGIHAFSFWSLAPRRAWKVDSDVRQGAFALVAPLGHVTLGDTSWRAQGCQILRLWIRDRKEAILARERYDVPVHSHPCPTQAGLAWAHNQLVRGRVLVEFEGGIE